MCLDEPQRPVNKPGQLVYTNTFNPLGVEPVESHIEWKSDNECVDINGVGMCWLGMKRRGN